MRSAELLLAAALLAPAAQAVETPAPPALSASAVRAAAERVKADPLLPGTEKEKVLRFKGWDKPTPAKDGAPDLWWQHLLGSITGGLRVAMWLVVTALLVLVLLRLRDWLKQRESGGALRAVPPTHVGTLDIRPQSLPEDLGAAARALAERGDVRAAMSLLYRGALSRLVHGHGVPIRAASTEQDCLALAAPRLQAESREFLVLLVRSWQTVAYARRLPEDDDVQRLCAEFEQRLGAAP